MGLIVNVITVKFTALYISNNNVLCSTVHGLLRTVGQFVRPALRLAFECVHGGSWQHNYEVWMALALSIQGFVAYAMGVNFVRNLA